MRVCIVWEMIPEETKLYVVDVTEEQVEKLKKAHGTYFNINENEATEWLNEWIEGKDSVQGPQGPVDLVILSGFVM